MSCDWEYFCTNCDERAGRDGTFNHAPEVLAEALEHRVELAALTPTLEKLSWHFGGDNVPWILVQTSNFFRKHAAHEIVVRSEYGETWNTCAKDIRCCTAPKCTHSHHCVLERGHAGSCSLQKVVREPSPLDPSTLTDEDFRR